MLLLMIVNLKKDVIDEVIMGQVLTGGTGQIQRDKLHSLQESQLKKVPDN